MIDWFASLTTDLLIFYLVAITASLVLLAQVGLSLLGIGDLDLDAEFDVGDHGSGIGVLSLRTLTAFFGGFGWAGVIALEAGSSLLVAFLAGVLSGGVLASLVAYLWRILYGLQQDANIRVESAIGQIATVYIGIPPLESGPGKVQILIQGQLRILPAYTRAGRRIGSQARVRVTDVIDQRTVMVEPLEETNQQHAGDPNP